MKNGIKIDNVAIEDKGKNVEIKIKELQSAYENIKKSKTLICENWHSEAAMKFIANIDAEEKNIKKIIKIIKEDKAYVEKSSKEITEIDSKISRILSNSEI